MVSMKKEWQHCKNILCVRPDNMGDLLMSTPAIRALKQTLNCSITVLTSSMAAGVARYIPEIDQPIKFDLPWIKTDKKNSLENYYSLIEEIRKNNFDAAVIFTVYSQNPMPSIMLTWLAGIPLRLSYCRENPYALLTDWIPDREPYSFIEHQVRRDLNLVASIGAVTNNERLSLGISKNKKDEIENKLTTIGVDIKKPWLVVHPGVSEEKREYPAPLWIKTCKKIITELGHQVLLTGTIHERHLTNYIQSATGKNSYSLAGGLSLEEFICLINLSPLVVSVNTGTIHIAAALEKPVIVLYALTNPQHLPWKAKGKALLYDVPESSRSKNEVIRFVHEELHPKNTPMVRPGEIVNAVREILLNEADAIPEMISLRNNFISKRKEERADIRH
jgi:lipopolysaccharide heptosyltransferase II